LRRSKTEYLHCRFSAEEDDVVDEVTMEGAILSNEKFRYLRMIIQGNGEIDEDISQ